MKRVQVLYLGESGWIREDMAEEVEGAPVLTVEGRRVGARRYRLLERESDGSQWVGKAIIGWPAHLRSNRLIFFFELRTSEGASG